MTTQQTILTFLFAQQLLLSNMGQVQAGSLKGGAQVFDAISQEDEYGESEGKGNIRLIVVGFAILASFFIFALCSLFCVGFGFGGTNKDDENDKNKNIKDKLDLEAQKELVKESAEKSKTLHRISEVEDLSETSVEDYSMENQSFEEAC